LPWRPIGGADASGNDAIAGRQCDPTAGQPVSRSVQVKPHDIDVQRLTSMKHDKGLIEVSLDATVTTRSARDGQAASSCLRLPVEHARTLLLLLKQQLAELDKLQPRSRRSGRA
jgi:hypothetical protein